MRTLRHQFHWTIALIAGFCLVAAAVTVAQKPDIPEPVSAANIRELSNAFRDVAQKALPAVVTIETIQKADETASEQMDEFEGMLFGDPRFREFFRRMPRRSPQPSEGMGSGFIIDSSGLIVTNNHVVQDADEIIVRLHDGREFKGQQVKTDPRSDLAILKIDAGDRLQTLRFGSSDDMQIGDWVVAVGNPFGHELTVTSGIISAKGRGPGITEREDFLQTDAAINPGNSGGPLLNLNGDVIGVNTAISSRSGGFDGIGFAVPSRMAHWVVQQLVEHGHVRRAYLGITIQMVDNGLAQQLGVKVGEGAIVTNLLEGSPGKAAGLQEGDVVLSLNGEKVTSPRNLQGIVERLMVDQAYPVDIIRDGKPMKIMVTLKEMPKDFSLAQTLQPNQRGRQPGQPDSVTIESFGFEIQNLTPELSQQLGIAAKNGVVVSSVRPNGPAARVLSAGDLITRVGSQPVTSVAEFNETLKRSDPAKGLLLLVRTGNSTRFVAINPAR